VTGSIFQDWFCSSFVPTVKAYLLKNNLAFKCLLLLDNASGHLQCVGDLFPEIKVVFLPPNTTLLLQLMDKTVIAAFKRYYARRTVTQAIKLVQSLKNYGATYGMESITSEIYGLKISNPQ
jgi:hypothetical protein